MIYSKPIKWIDSNRIVEQYKEEYTKLFHIFSTLAILVPHQDMNRVFDRIVHSFCNHSHYKMADPLNPRDPYWEQEFIAKNALDRATYNGYRIGLAIGNKQ